ncbi:MAG TPA: type VI secretion system baseplate subunit TssG [Longimicrobiaceae bacterium]|nr:type VI secretion system baseplate subunit TssG [Longimicrobiaceae bacterium]
MEAPPVGLEELARLLQDEPTSFGFFQAVRVLERLSPERDAVGGFGDPADEVVRFATNPATSFPPGEISALSAREDEPARMVVNFLGLTGPQGVLPLHYSLLVAERARARDTALRDFLDLFHHRVLSLFYRAWARHRGNGDLLTPHLLDLLGIGTDHLTERLALPHERLLDHAGLLGPQGRSAVALEELIESFFDVPARVEQFVGGWYPIERETQCALGEELDASTQLGLGAVVGDEIWDPQARVRIRIGPLTRARYDEFLPSGSAFRELEALTDFFVGGHFDFELQLVLARDEAPAPVLGGDDPSPLGWATWLHTRPLPRDPDEVVFTFHQRGSEP